MGNYLAPLNTKLDADQVIRRIYNEITNRIRVDAEVTATIGTVSVVIDAASGDNIKISDGVDSLDITSDNAAKVRVSHVTDSTRLGDGTNLITSTTSGLKTGLDVNILDDTLTVIEKNVINQYEEVTSVANSTLTTVLSKTFSVLSNLKRVSCSGTNIAEYRVILDGDIISKKRTYLGNSLNVDFIFDEEGLELLPTSVLEIKVIHSRPDLGDFESNILYTEAI